MRRNRRFRRHGRPCPSQPIFSSEAGAWFDFNGRIVRVFFGYRIVGEHVEGCEGAGGHDFAPEAVVAPIDGVGAVVFARRRSARSRR